MKREIRRHYSFSPQEVREAILCWLKSKDAPRPEYVGNTPTCTWSQDAAGAVAVVWTDEDELN